MTAENPGPQPGTGCVCRSESQVALSLTSLGWEGRQMWFEKLGQCGTGSASNSLSDLKEVLI